MLRKENKMAVVDRDSQKEHPRDILLIITIAPNLKEKYMTQVPEEIEGKVT